MLSYLIPEAWTLNFSSWYHSGGNGMWSGDPSPCCMLHFLLHSLSSHILQVCLIVMDIYCYRELVQVLPRCAMLHHPASISWSVVIHDQSVLRCWYVGNNAYLLHTVRSHLPEYWDSENLKTVSTTAIRELTMLVGSSSRCNNRSK